MGAHLLIIVGGCGIAALTFFGCGGKSGGGTISCESQADCPIGLVCDLEDGKCKEPGEDDPFNCVPALPGCPCSTGAEPTSCLLEGQDFSIVGSCREGRSICVDGFYQPCELVANPYCTQLGASAGDFDLDTDNSSNVELGPEGEIVLDPDTKQVSFGFLWVANTGENTVSKIDIETGNEVARYASVRDSDSLGVPAVPSPGGYNGDQSSCGNCPSRTAIDFEGDAFVANRNFDGQGSLTKFANSLETCIDRNGNSSIETSTDVDGDGRIDVNDPAEFLGEADECILWTVPVGGNRGVPRALAIDAGGPDGEAGNVWVGLYAESRIIQLSGDTGAPIMAGGSPVSVDLRAGGESMSPYGAAVDGGGNLWVTGLDDGGITYLAKVNTYSAELIQLYGITDDDDGCSEGYGIAIDTSQRIWLGGWECRDLKAFDPATETFHRVDLDDESNTRGVAVDIAGNVWVALNAGKVGKFRIDDIITLGQNAPREVIDLPETFAPYDGPVGTTIGVGIDRNGACWAVSRNDATQYGTATRIDTAGNVDSFPVGHRPYTYSDFTGFGLSTVVRPNGFWRGNLEGCATTGDLTDWTQLMWYENEPPGTAVRMRLRVADTIAGLASASWFGPWDTPPVDLDAEGVPDSRYIQVEVQLSTTDADVTPSFTGFVLNFNCPGIDPVE